MLKDMQYLPHLHTAVKSAIQFYMCTFVISVIKIIRASVQSFEFILSW